MVQKGQVDEDLLLSVSLTARDHCICAPLIEKIFLVITMPSAPMVKLQECMDGQQRLAEFGANRGNSVTFTACWMATRTTSHTTKSVTTLSQRPCRDNCTFALVAAETVVNFNQKPPRKRKAQEPGAQEEQPASKRRKQVCLSPKAANCF